LWKFQFHCADDLRKGFAGRAAALFRRSGMQSCAPPQSLHTFAQVSWHWN
jgi:hypothetical protein